AEDGIRDGHVTGVQTCALPIFALKGQGAFGGAVINVVLERPQIDLGYTGGTGILMAAILNSYVLYPNIYNIAAKGTWSYTDGEGTGTLPNAGIVMAGGNVNNVENVEIVGGLVGNYNSYVSGAPDNYTRCTHLGGAG